MKFLLEFRLLFLMNKSTFIKTGISSSQHDEVCEFEELPQQEKFTCHN